jgi:two-component system, NtrC family, response regulator HydG
MAVSEQAASPPREEQVVLLVEDEPSLREMVSEFLQYEGYQVLEARDGKQAVQILNERLPPPEYLCMVLLDMMMPRLDGMDVLHHLANLGEYVPVVAMSANRELLAEAAAAGARATLPKPFDLDRLARVVARNCSSPPAEQ